MSGDDRQVAGEGTSRPGGVHVKGVVRNLAILGAVAALVAFLSSREGSRPDGGDAVRYCTSLVRERLPIPSTARFERSADVRVSRRQADWVVDGYVVARDSAGGRLARRYTCVLQPVSNQDWRLVDLSITPHPS